MNSTPSLEPVEMELSLLDITKPPDEDIVPIGLPLELGLMFGLAILCFALFGCYLFLARGEEIVPAEYYMKRRLPMIKRVIEVKKEAKKQAKKNAEEVVQLF